MKTSRLIPLDIGAAASLTREDRLCLELKQLPKAWQLTPTYRKRPYRPSWRTENLSRKRIATLIKFGDRLKGENSSYTVRPDGLALLVPLGCVAVDIDGRVARWLAKTLAAGEVNPKTVAWTSGKVGRLTALYRLPDSLAQQITGLDRPLRKVILNQGIKHYGEAIELQLAGQSVTIAPSAHPETDGYRWKLSPEQVEVAEAPQWVCREIEAAITAKTSHKQVSLGEARSWDALDSSSLQDAIEQALGRIDPDCHRDDWFKVGAALHSAGDQWFELFDEWSAQGSKYQAGCTDKLWDSLERREGGITLGSLFRLAGIRFGAAMDGKGVSQQDEAERLKQQRDWAIQTRLDTFKEKFWPALQQDFLMGKADTEYSGWCPQIDIGLSQSHLIQGWLGAGKTESMLRAVKQFQIEHPDRLVVWVANRNGLLHNTLTRAHSLGIQAWHYQSDVSGNRELIQANHGGLILMCAESFKDYAVDSIDWSNTVLIIDEFRALRCGAQNLSSEFPQIQQALAEVHTMIVADAFLSDADRGVLKPYRGRNRIVYRQQSDKSPKRVKWVELLTKKGLTSFKHDAGYFAILDQMIAQGGRQAIAVDSRLLANIFGEYLRTKGQTVLVSSGETVDSNKFVLPNPTAAIERENPDWFIYTPSIQAGADIQAKFDRGLLVSTGVLSPVDMLQMLGRCRQCPEWYVSAPRFSAGDEDSAPFRQFSGKQVGHWAEQAAAAFQGLEIEIDGHTQRWAQWQTATREIERAYNSEYLLCLLQHFFESVEVVEVAGEDTEKFIGAVVGVKNAEVARCLQADLQTGQQLIDQKKAPQTDSEYWDIELAKWRADFPEIVDRLQQGIIQGFKLTNDFQSHLDIGRLFRSRKVDKLKAYRMAGRKDIEAELERRIKSRRFVSPQSRTWRQYRSICLFRALDLERLANCKGEVILNQTGYTADSPIAAELWAMFQASRKLRDLFPEVEEQGDLWQVVCRTMSGFGFQSVAKKVRVQSDVLTPNGKRRDGSQRFTSSKVVHASAWKPHADGGSKLFRANYDAIIQAVDGHLDREQERWDDFYFRQEQRRQEAEAIAA
ncbi:MAG: PriCT-2 domain-containing protein [Elainella sp.]